MLVPLQTLFGWPSAPEVTPLKALGLLGGIPLVFIVLVFAVAKAHAVMMTSKHGAGPRASDPVWMGGRAASIMGGADPQLNASTDEPRRQLEESGSSGSTALTGPAEAGTGGAGARW